MINRFLFLKRKLATAGLIILIWVFTALFATLHEYLFLTNYPGVTDTAPMQEYSFISALIPAIAWAIMGGILFSIIELFYLQRKLQNLSFLGVVSIKFVVYFAMLVSINIATSLLYNSLTLGKSLVEVEVWNRTMEFVTSISFWHPVTPFLLILLATLFLIQINYKFGQGELWKYIRGKYFQPREEERIFLFLDIVSSTAIAEKLGHIRFFNFINDFYKDITDTILHSKGEIVDYVGDEIIISWDLSEGVNDSTCIRCVMNIKTKIDEVADRYEKSYGVVPTFRSGLHYGRATVGEIGKIKKEITYFGDVINTTSRIQGLSKEAGYPLVFSNELLERLPLNNFDIKSLGEVQLRGKSGKTELYGISIE